MGVNVIRTLLLLLDDTDLPKNWDQAKDDNQSYFKNKSDKNDQEPYTLALSEEGKRNYTEVLPMSNPTTVP